jgi:hypothetical protein
MSRAREHYQETKKKALKSLTAAQPINVNPWTELVDLSNWDLGDWTVSDSFFFLCSKSFNLWCSCLRCRLLRSPSGCYYSIWIYLLQYWPDSTLCRSLWPACAAVMGCIGPYSVYFHFVRSFSLLNNSL